MNDHDDLSDRPSPNGSVGVATATPVLTRPVPEPVRAAPEPVKPARRPVTRTTRIGLSLILVLSLLEALGLGARYYFTDRVWVIVDSAQVVGDQIQINAPASGVLRNWRIDVGSPIVPNQLLGYVEMQGSRARQPIRAQGRGTVAQSSASEGEYVQSGTQLAVAYGDGGMYITARVPEDDVRDVRQGAPVDVLADAAPNTPLSGTVEQIGAATAGVFELQNLPTGDPTNLDEPVYPGPDTDPQNPQPVDQYVPVKIALTNPGSDLIRPGMNVTVHIHKE